jgi:Mrp family chromosome partitioning ATPase
MGRTLDTLRHGETHRTPSASSTHALDAAPPEECVVDWTLQEEVPFIEIGGPGKKVELSPSLVKHPPQAKVQAPHSPLGQSLAAPKAAPIVDLTEARPMAVAFEVWPGSPARAGIAAEVIAYHQPDHAVSKDYAILFEKMMQSHAGPGPHWVLLCGLKPRVGTSTVLLNLAVVAARMRRRVAVVDMNLARPALAARLGHAGPHGVHDVLSGSVAIGQAVVPTLIPALSLLPAGSTGKKNGTLTAEAVAWLAAWLRERHDLIFVDGPCVEEAADIAVLAPGADGVYLVLPQGESDSVARGIAPSISRMGGRLRGLIHTHFEG